MSLVSKTTYPTGDVATITRVFRGESDSHTEVYYGPTSQIQYSNPGDCPCQSLHYSSQMKPYNGFIKNSSPEWYTGPGAGDYVQNNYAGISRDPGGTSLDRFHYVEDTARLLSRTNPTKPLVSVPNFIFELKDVPGMLRGEGFALFGQNAATRGISKRVASAYLSGHFGWGPLLSDVMKMIQFSDSVLKTFRKLKRAHSDKGQSGKLVYGEDSVLDKYENESRVYAYTDTTVSHKVICYGTCCWKALQGIPDTDEALLKRALQTTFGLGLTPRQLWDALPWSWFIDWFANVGDFISSNMNILECVPDRVWTHTKLTSVQTTSVRQYISPGLSGGDGSATRVQYWRKIAAAPALMATLPILDTGQVETATALITQRRI